MKVVDLDCLRGKEDGRLVNQWLMQSMVPLHLATGVEFRPNEAIYFVTTKQKITNRTEARELLESFGLIKAGHVVASDSVVGLLQRMVEKIDEAAKEMGLSVTGKFRQKNGPHHVLTDKNFSEIERMNAIPLPAWMIGIGDRVGLI